MADDLIYLDNAATSRPKPPEVAAAVAHALTEGNANPGRGSHRLAVAATRLVFESRESVAELLGIGPSERLVFTANATDGLNLAIHGVLTGPGHAVCSHFEHNAVLRPLRAWQGRTGSELTILPPGGAGLFELGALRRALRPDTRLVVLGHASNVTGELAPIEEAAEICRAAGVPLLVDAAQTAGHLPLLWDRIPAAAMAAAGHKGLLGPQGTGVLYLAPGLEPEPVRQGGTGGNSEEEHQPPWLPERYESGTVNTPGIAGLGAGARWLRLRGLDALRRREVELTERLLAGLSGIPEIRVYGAVDPQRRVGVVSLNLAGWDPVALGTALDARFGILVRTGLHCAPLAHRAVGSFPRGTARLSLGPFTTTGELDASLEALRWLAVHPEAADCPST